jgi:hypothetical protein
MNEEAFLKLLTNYEETMKNVTVIEELSKNSIFLFKQILVLIRGIYIFISKENPGLSGLGRPGSGKAINYC